MESRYYWFLAILLSTTAATCLAQSNGVSCAISPELYRLVLSSPLPQVTQNSTCNRGEYAEKKLTTECRNGQWINVITITCKVRNCGLPILPEKVTADIDSTTYGSLVNYSCPWDYLLQGAYQVRCQENGSWTDQPPICERIECEPFKLMNNGQVHYTEPFWPVNSIAIFSCNDPSFEMIGDSQTTCLHMGNYKAAWSHPAPSCEKKMCGEPPRPEHAILTGSVFIYGASVSYVCDRGYVLKGDHVLTCTDTWHGQTPSCEAIHCRKLNSPGFGYINDDNTLYGSRVTFTCILGYSLVGSDTVVCGEEGQWTDQEPSCQPVPCPLVRAPRNGAKEGNMYTYGQSVTFICYPGYVLRGDKRMTCTSNGRWNSETPYCEACPVGFYKEDTSSAECLPCPGNSTTSSDGSFSRQLCTCVSGFRGEQGGPCSRISCEPLTAPENGTSSNCGNTLYDECEFRCNPGYVLQGSNSRRCLSDGWSGTPVMCSECPVDTYKTTSDLRTCSPCPSHSHTQGIPGKLQEDCVCKEGYRGPPGGPCVDVDECEIGNGGCSNVCINLLGGFSCSCSTPGYQLANDGTACLKVRSCPEPNWILDNGQLQCSEFENSNSMTCFFRCNPSYDFVSGTNNYITCGQTTNFIWSHQVLDETNRLPACTKEHVVDGQLSVSLHYIFPERDTCNPNPVTTGAIQQVLQNAINNTCPTMCQVKAVAVTCEDDEDITIKINATVIVGNSAVDRVVGVGCNDTCRVDGIRKIVQETAAVGTRFEELVKKASPELDVLGQVPVKNSFQQNQLQLSCPPGQVLTQKRFCAPCDVGFHYINAACNPCPVNKYQPKLGQTSCMDCPPGTTTVATGQKSCIALAGVQKINVTEQLLRFRRPEDKVEPIDDPSDYLEALFK